MNESSASHSYAYCDEIRKKRGESSRGSQISSCCTNNSEVMDLNGDEGNDLSMTVVKGHSRPHVAANGGETLRHLDMISDNDYLSNNFGSSGSVYNSDIITMISSSHNVRITVEQLPQMLLKKIGKKSCIIHKIRCTQLYDVLK